jgi:hypothetical protein
MRMPSSMTKQSHPFDCDAAIVGSTLSSIGIKQNAVARTAHRHAGKYGLDTIGDHPRSHSC